MLWLMLANETTLTPWEQRVGSFWTTCPRCQQQAWQLTYRIYRTSGSGLQGPTPYGPPLNECFQVRCATCFSASMVAHPSTWVQSIGVQFNNENHAPTHGTPQYIAQAYSGGGY
ncbi:MAG: hypothetical protein JNL38_20650 [Myxococcales bacterium]|jgi:hypothetical protein|nr:hypothetical protein [Myxococcales bacterium]